MRRSLAFVAVCAAMAWYLLRSVAERQLVRLRDRRKGRHRRHQVLLPNERHLYSPERYWPGSCWCGQANGHLQHQGRL